LSERATAPKRAYSALCSNYDGKHIKELLTSVRDFVFLSEKDRRVFYTSKTIDKAIGRSISLKKYPADNERTRTRTEELTEDEKRKFDDHLRIFRIIFSSDSLEE
jgi:hypothetical protein